MESVYNTHHGFEGQFHQKKCALYTGKYGILYNSKKKAKSVTCKIDHMHSQLCFFISGYSGVPVNAHGNIDRFRAIVQLDTINECLQLLVEVFMKVMNGLVMTLEEDKIFMCLAALLCAISPIRE